MSAVLLPYYVTLALGIMVGASRFSRLSPGSRWFYALLVLTAAVEGVAWYSGRIYNTNLLVYRLFGPVQFALFALACSGELVKARTAIRATAGVILLVYAVDTYLHRADLMKVYHTLPRTASGMGIIFWTLYYLRQLLETQTDRPFSQYPLFWLSIGWLQFSIITLFNLGAMNYLNTLDIKYTFFFTYVRTGSNVILYGLFTVAFLTRQYQLPTPAHD